MWVGEDFAPARPTAGCAMCRTFCLLLLWHLPAMWCRRRGAHTLPVFICLAGTSTMHKMTVSWISKYFSSFSAYPLVYRVHRGCQSWGWVTSGPWLQRSQQGWAPHPCRDKKSAAPKNQLKWSTPPLCCCKCGEREKHTWCLGRTTS